MMIFWPNRDLDRLQREYLKRPEVRRQLVVTATVVLAFVCVFMPWKWGIPFSYEVPPVVLGIGSLWILLGIWYLGTRGSSND